MQSIQKKLYETLFQKYSKVFKEACIVISDVEREKYKNVAKRNLYIFEPRS